MKRGVLLIFTIILALAAGAWYYFKVPNDKEVKFFDGKSTCLVIEGELVTDMASPKLDEGEILLPIETVKKYIDPYIYWDEALQKVTVTTRDKVIRMETDNLDALVNNKPVNLNMPVTIDNKVVYIPIRFLSDFYGINIQYIEKNKVVIIDRKNSVLQLARPIDEKAVVRTGRSIRKPIVKRLVPGDYDSESSLRIFEEYDRWYRVRTKDGELGYIEKKLVAVTRVLVPGYAQYKEKEEPWMPENGKINLTWELSYSKRPDLAALPSMDGLDVISPTWFDIVDAKGNMLNKTDTVYLDWARSKGYRLWPRLANLFGDPDATSRLLNNTDARDNVIKQVLAYAALYKLDGINIDFENIYLKDKDALTQFVREITPFLKEQGLVVSMDIGVPGGSENYSQCYDSEELAKAVDYIMVMTYDQHWSTSPQAGSVAQLVWVESKLRLTLQTVPKEKLILGLPFYSRLWKETPDGNGGVNVSSPGALAMDKANELIIQKAATKTWDEESGQYYIEYSEGSETYRMWLENEESINLKSSLVLKYELAGAAAWRRDHASDGVWKVLDRNLKETGSYRQWEKNNTGV